MGYRIRGIRVPLTSNPLSPLFDPLSRLHSDPMVHRLNSEEEVAAAHQHLAGAGVSYEGLPEYGHQSGEDVSIEATQKMIDSLDSGEK